MTAPPTPTFTVTCNANGGIGGTSFTVDQGTSVNPNAWCNTVSRSGHTFAGWSPGTTTVNSNTTFVAQWTVNHIPVWEYRLAQNNGFQADTRTLSMPESTILSNFTRTATLSCQRRDTALPTSQQAWQGATCPSGNWRLESGTGSNFTCSISGATLTIRPNAAIGSFGGCASVWTPNSTANWTNPSRFEFVINLTIAP